MGIGAARAFAGEVDHARRQVQADHPGAARRRLEGEVAGAAGQVEDAFARRDRGGGDQAALPVLIAAVRQQPRDQVVAVGDGRKQPRDVAGLPIGRRQRVAQTLATARPAAPLQAQVR